MAHAEKCPVCEGSGLIGMEYTLVPAYGELTHDNIQNHTGCAVCHGCGGKGWVEVEDTSPQRLEDVAREAARVAIDEFLNTPMFSPVAEEAE